MANATSAAYRESRRAARVMSRRRIGVAPAAAGPSTSEGRSADLGVDVVERVPTSNRAGRRGGETSTLERRWSASVRCSSARRGPIFSLRRAPRAGRRATPDRHRRAWRTWRRACSRRAPARAPHRRRALGATGRASPARRSSEPDDLRHDLGRHRRRLRGHAWTPLADTDRPGRFRTSCPCCGPPTLSMSAGLRQDHPVRLAERSFWPTSMGAVVRPRYEAQRWWTAPPRPDPLTMGWARSASWPTPWSVRELETAV